MTYQIPPAPFKKEGAGTASIVQHNLIFSSKEVYSNDI